MREPLKHNRISVRYSEAWGSTNDQLLHSALHDRLAMRYAAERRNLDESIEGRARSPMAATTYLPRPQASLPVCGYRDPARHVGDR